MTIFPSDVHPCIDKSGHRSLMKRCSGYLQENIFVNSSSIPHLLSRYLNYPRLLYMIFNHFFVLQKSEICYFFLQNLHWSDLIASSDKQTDQLCLSETERKRREAVWELFKSECVFLIDHLMVLKHVSIMNEKKVVVF